MTKEIEILKARQNKIATSREFCAEEDLFMWDMYQKEIEQKIQKELNNEKEK